jgi:hypothetical protein
VTPMCSIPLFVCVFANFWFLPAKKKNIFWKWETRVFQNKKKQTNMLYLFELHLFFVL